jgi:hypothetical protein
MCNLNQNCINEIYLPVTPQVELPLNFRPEFGANLVFEFATNSGLKFRANSTRGVTGSNIQKNATMGRFPKKPCTDYFQNDIFSRGEGP